MTESELLDALAKAIDSKRERGRLDRIKKAFAEYTAHRQKRWWVSIRTMKKWRSWRKEA